MFNILKILRNHTSSKTAVFLLCIVPLALMLLGAIKNSLGPDPAEALADISGEWTLRFLLLTLLMTPLRKLTSNPKWVQYRRMLGLFTFFYATLHLLVYLFFLLGLQWSHFYADVLERPYITAGLLAIVLMFPLALTSSKRWRRRLGRHWRQLHRLIYVVAIVVLIHLWWQVRSDYSEAILYTLIVLILFLARIKKPVRCRVD